MEIGEVKGILSKLQYPTEQELKDVLLFVKEQSDKIKVLQAENEELKTFVKAPPYSRITEILADNDKLKEENKMRRKQKNVWRALADDKNNKLTKLKEDQAIHFREAKEVLSDNEKLKEENVDLKKANKNLAHTNSVLEESNVNLINKAVKQADNISDITDTYTKRLIEIKELKERISITSGVLDAFIKTNEPATVVALENIRKHLT